MERLFPLGEQFCWVCWRGRWRGSLGTAGRSEEPFFVKLDPAGPLYATVLPVRVIPSVDSVPKVEDCGLSGWKCRPCGAVGLTFPGSR